MNLDKWLDAQTRTFQIQDGLPWAFIFFDGELPLSGHVAQLRGAKYNMAMGSYSWLGKNHSPIVPGRLPGVSTIFVRKKAILKHVAEKSELFKPAWEALKDKSPDGLWMCVSDLPPAGWIKATSVGNEELFFKYRRTTDVTFRSPALLKNKTLAQAYVTGVNACSAEDWAIGAGAILRVVENEPDIPEAWHVLGICNLYLDDLDGAIHALEQAHALEPCWTPTTVHLALAYGRKKKYDLALQKCIDALDIDPFCEIALEYMATALELKGEMAAAISARQRLQELNHRDVPGWQRLFTLLHNTGRDVEAVEVCRELVALQPDDAGAWNDLGFMLAYVGRCGEGVEACNKALELNPIFVEAWDSLGYAHLMAGDYNKAIPCLRKAMEYKPDYAAAWRHLLHAYKRSGKEALFKSARTYLRGILPQEAALVDEEIRSEQARPAP